MRLLAAAVAALLLAAGCTGDPERGTTTRAVPSSTPASAPPTIADPALVEAARRGDAPAVDRLLRGGAAVDATGADGLPALRKAVEDGDGSPGYVDTARLLVARGAAVPPSLAERARSHAQDAVVAILSAAQAAPPADPAATLLAAATSGDADAAAMALRAGAGLEIRDVRSRTPLLLAVTGDRLEVARLLVALGADPDALDDRHDTPWLVTGVTGSVPMLEILLPAEPDLTIRNRFGGVSVIPASERGHVEYVRRVVQTGIDVNHANDPGWTALLEAVVYGKDRPRTRRSCASCSRPGRIRRSPTPAAAPRSSTPRRPVSTRSPESCGGAETPHRQRERYEPGFVC